jgi:hypothetical protein
MSETLYHGRRAHALDNGSLEIVVTVEGGHIAAVTEKATKLNPLWLPPWPSLEPSRYDPARHPGYGANDESKLLAGILGHSLCLDIFGGPSEAEAAAGLGVHGEAPVAAYDVAVSGDTLTQRTVLPQAQIQFTRTICLPAGNRVATVQETVENLSGMDRPIGWTQHVTLGPPFLEKGRTQFRANATRGKVFEQDFCPGLGNMKIGAEFSWPMAPCINGVNEDLRLLTNRPVSGAFATFLMDPKCQDAWFVAWSPTHRLAFGYTWKQADFPWLGLWEENHARAHKPWNGAALTRAMEFGVSPFPETRRAMVERGKLFGAPTCKWVPARSQLEAEYRFFLLPAESIPETLPAFISGEMRQTTTTKTP